MVWYFNIVCSVMWVGCLRCFVGGLFVCYWGVMFVVCWFWWDDFGG